MISSFCRLQSERLVGLTAGALVSSRGDGHAPVFQRQRCVELWNGIDCYMKFPSITSAEVGVHDLLFAVSKCIFVMSEQAEGGRECNLFAAVVMRV